VLLKGLAARGSPESSPREDPRFREALLLLSDAVKRSAALDFTEIDPDVPPHKGSTTLAFDPGHPPFPGDCGDSGRPVLFIFVDDMLELMDFC